MLLRKLIIYLSISRLNGVQQAFGTALDEQDDRAKLAEEGWPRTVEWTCKITD